MGLPKQSTRYLAGRAQLLSSLFTALLIVFFFCSCKNKSSDLPSIQGSWRCSFNGIAINEQWTKKGDSLVGKTIWSQDTNVRVNHLKIYFHQDTLIYCLKIPKNKPLLFRCKHPLKDTLVFVNEQNDFPKRIVYVLPKGRDMKVWNDNSPEDPNRISFAFEKIHN